MKTRKGFPVILIYAVTMALLLSSCSYLAIGNAGATLPPTSSPTETPRGIQTLPPASEPSTDPTASPTAVPTPSPSLASSASPTLDANRPVIGLYIPTGGKRELVDVFKADWVKGKDIDCFEAIASREKTLSGSGFKSIWNSNWGKFPKASEYKIGYCLSITLNSSETLTQTITTPEDTQVYKEYIETYLYDDIHQQPGVRYSHIVRADVKEDTIATSIKLTAGVKVSEVKEIKLTAFAYKGKEEFDAEGNYTGGDSYEITLIQNK